MFKLLRLYFQHIYRPILQERIIFKSIDDINNDVVNRRQFNYAYIFTDSAAEYMDMLLHTYISSAKSYKRAIRIMNEKLSKYTSNVNGTILFTKFRYISAQ